MAVGAGQKRKRKKQPEAAFQRALVKALAMVLPRDSMLFAVPNGGARNPIEAAILVGQGVVRGIPDLMILWDGHGFGMECKAGKGALTKDQVAVHQRFARAGVPVAVVRTLDEAFACLKAWNIPTTIKDAE